MNNGSSIHPNGLQPSATAAEWLVSARKQSSALKAISRYNFPWTVTLTHLFNMQIHSNNTVALTTVVQSPNKGRCLQLGYRVVSSTSQSAFILFNQIIRLPRCSFLKIGEMAKWKLLSIAWENLHLKFSLGKMNLEKWVCLLKNKIFASLKQNVFFSCFSYIARRSSINVIHWPVCVFSLYKLKQTMAYV